jgi:3-oxoacyl-[acyl-carrier protein] reductase
MRPQLKGKVAVITGAGRGIGKAIATKLALGGATIVVNYSRSSGEAQELVNEIEGNGGSALAVQADIARQEDVQGLFAEVDARFGRLDILVNNAGIACSATLDETTEDIMDRLFAVNVKGTLFAAQQAAKRLKDGGRIVNISSSTATFPLPGTSVYAGSKAMVKTFTEVWAKELGSRGITVNTVIPGPTSPGMFDHAPEEARRMVAQSSPFGRIGTADEVAAVVAFLCSEEARWVSGQHVLVNGAAAA